MDRCGDLRIVRGHDLHPLACRALARRGLGMLRAAVADAKKAQDLAKTAEPKGASSILSQRLPYAPCLFFCIPIQLQRLCSCCWGAGSTC